MGRNALPIVALAALFMALRLSAGGEAEAHQVRIACAGKVTPLRGSWVVCRTAEPITVGAQVIPKGSRVSFDGAARDLGYDYGANKPRWTWWLDARTTLQEHVCKPGPDWAVSFHDNGVLASCGLAEPEIIEGVPCAAASRRAGSAKFHPNGRLGSCTAGRRFSLRRCTFGRGDVIALDPTGTPRC